MDRAERARLFDAALAELGKRGFAGMSIDAVLAQARVSRASFEAEFKDTDSCLFAAYDDLTERLIAKAKVRCDREEEWPQRVRGGLEALLEELSSRPEMARVLIRSFPAIRPAAFARYMEFLETFTQGLSGGRALSEMEGEPPGEIEMLAIGAAEAVVFDEIDAGRASSLPTLAPSILFSLLVPFMGPERALAAAPSEGRAA